MHLAKKYSIPAPQYSKSGECPPDLLLFLPTHVPHLGHGQLLIVLCILKVLTSSMKVCFAFFRFFWCHYLGNCFRNPFQAARWEVPRRIPMRLRGLFQRTSSSWVCPTMFNIVVKDLFISGEKRAEVKAANPDWKIGDIAKVTFSVIT